jgi:hypothetical protein
MKQSYQAERQQASFRSESVFEQRKHNHTSRQMRARVGQGMPAAGDQSRSKLKLNKQLTRGQVLLS